MIIKRKLAAFFGYEDNDDTLAVEQFMHRYYRTAMHIAELNQTLLQLFDQAILHAHDEDVAISISRRFELRNGRLQACYPSVYFYATHFPSIEALCDFSAAPKVSCDRS